MTAPVRFFQKFGVFCQALNSHPGDLSPKQQPDGQFSKEKAELMVAIAVKNGSHSFEWVCQRPDGLNLLLKVLLNVIGLGGETVIHGVWRDITKQKQVEESLRKAKEDLERKAVELEDTNTALKVLLQKRDQDNLELQENIYANYELMLTPFLNVLKNRLDNRNQHNLLDIIEINLQEIVAPFAKKLANPMMGLTSSEIQIATMIKQGYSNKEIATILNSSKRTIDTHRQNIRRKLKLNNEKINLKTYLMNL